MYEEKRTVCRIEVRKDDVEITCIPPDGKPRKAQGKFDHEYLLNELPRMRDQIEEYGCKLRDKLFEERQVEFVLWFSEEFDPDAMVQVCIEISDRLYPRLRDVHWEYLCDRTKPNHRMLATTQNKFRLVRRLKSVGGVDLSLLPQQPPRVLVVISNPDDLEEPRRAKEDPSHFGIAETPSWPRSIISQAIHDLCERFEDFRRQNWISDYQILGVPERDQNKFLDEFYPHPRDELKGKLFPAIYPSKERIREVLEAAVNQREPDPHHIVHFLAHGYLDDDGKGRLVLTDEEGYAFSVRQDEFSHLFPANHSVRLVFFAACQSDKQVSSRLAGLAPSVLQAGVDIPAVIAMQDEISVGAANLFTRAFYEALGRPGYIDTAVTIARAALANSTEYGHEWGIPVLYLQSNDPRFFTVAEPPGRRFGREPSAQSRRRILIKHVRVKWPKSDPEKLWHDVPPIKPDMEYQDCLVDCRDERLPNLDWYSSDRHRHVASDKITQIFEERDRTLLILGGPGSGKTTVLRKLLHDLLKRAEGPHGGPVPVQITLQSWAGYQSDEGRSIANRFRDRRVYGLTDGRWRDERQSIANKFRDWLVYELNDTYPHFGPDAFRAWVDNLELIFLLDGLEQVEPQHRVSCIQAINHFRKQHSFAGIAVCSDTDVYKGLADQSVRLRFKGAVELQDLEPDQIDDYLKSAGDDLAGLRDALGSDDGIHAKLKELAKVPEKLAEMIYRYREMPAESRSDFNQLHNMIVTEDKAQYRDIVKDTFEKRGIGAEQGKQIVRRLVWLAKMMKQHVGESRFYIERMQPDWSLTPEQQRLQQRLHTLVTMLIVLLFIGIPTWLVLHFAVDIFLGPDYSHSSFYDAVVGPLFGLAVGLFTWQAARRVSGYRAAVGAIAVGMIFWMAMGLCIWRVYYKWPKLGLLGGFAFALVIGVVCYLFVRWLARGLPPSRRLIEMVERKNFTWSKAAKGFVLGFIGALAVWLVLDISRAIVLERMTFWQALREMGTFKTAVWQLFGQPALASFSLVGLWLQGFRGGEVAIEEQESTNQGLRRSIQSALFIGVPSALIVGLIFAVWLPLRLADDLYFADFLPYLRSFGLSLGLLAGLLGGLVFGGFPVIQHGVLRLILGDYVPLWGYANFLDHAVQKLGFLVKRGGSYDFRDPWLRYFADLDLAQRNDTT